MSAHNDFFKINPVGSHFPSWHILLCYVMHFLNSTMGPDSLILILRPYLLLKVLCVVNVQWCLKNKSIVFWLQYRPFLWTCSKTQHFVQTAPPLSFSNCTSEAVAAGLLQHCKIIMISHGWVVLWTNMANKGQRKGRTMEANYCRLEVLAVCLYSYSSGCWFTANELSVELWPSINSDCEWNIQMLNFLPKYLMQIFVHYLAEIHHYWPWGTIKSWPNILLLTNWTVEFLSVVGGLWHLIQPTGHFLNKNWYILIEAWPSNVDTERPSKHWPQEE